MRVSDCMSTDLTLVAASTTVGEAAALMGQRGIGSVLVSDDGGPPAAIFTERDIVRALSQSFDAPAQPISAWMTEAPETIGADADVTDALRLMHARHFRHLPVVEAGRLVGMVSMRDLSRARIGGV
jgi:CBS domain-containing protein